MSEIVYDEASLPRAKGGLTTAAIGATLAMGLPAILFFMAVASEGKAINFDTFGVVVILAFVGILVWAIGMSYTLKPLKSQSNSSGVSLVSTTLYLLFVAWLITTGVATSSFDKGFEFGYNNSVVLIGGFILVQILLGVGTSKMSSSVNGLKLSSVCYFVIAAILIILLIMVKSSSMYSNSNITMAKVLVFLAMFAALLAVVGWWIAASKGIAIYPDDTFAVTESAAPAVVTPPTPPAVPSTPSEPATPASVTPPPVPTSASGLPQALEDKLLAMEDAQLQDIVDNPSLYANAAYVNEAQNILQKRRAWEAINDKSDEDLMAIVLDPNGLYTYTVRDAASMELFSRDSSLLIDALKDETVDSLRNIVANTDDYFDGYVSMARQILAQKQQ